MTEARLEIACPFCKADAGQTYFSVQGHRMSGFHYERTFRDCLNKPITKGAVPVSAARCFVSFAEHYRRPARGFLRCPDWHPAAVKCAFPAQPESSLWRCNDGARCFCGARRQKIIAVPTGNEIEESVDLAYEIFDRVLNIRL
jgi:hypothetical protein